VGDHLAHGVPDLRLATLPGRYDELLELDLPIEEDEILRLRDFRSGFEELCEELASYQVPETIQHDDLHHANLYVNGDEIRVLDWGDSSISHPFASLVVTFRFLEERHWLAPDDPWFERLRDAYLEPWGEGFGPAVPLAIRLGSFARAIAYLRQREALDGEARARFDVDFSIVLRRAVAHCGQDR
jgi:aminoglycoside phosphotransferase (APT) family kinase protein